MQRALWPYSVFADLTGSGHLTQVGLDDDLRYFLLEVIEYQTQAATRFITVRDGTAEVHSVCVQRCIDEGLLEYNPRTRGGGPPWGLVGE